MPRELKFVFPLKNGFHARPASNFQEVANRYASKITLINEENHCVANGKSTLSLVGTMTKCGDHCVLRVEGDDELPAYEHFRMFLAEEFPLCDEDLPQPAGGQPGEVRIPRILRTQNVPFHTGIPISSGIACSRAFVMNARSLTLPDEARVRRTDQEEITRIQRAVEDLERSYRGRVGARGPEGDILKAHLSIIQDSEFQSKILDEIETGHRTAGEAILATAEHYTRVLQQSESEYLRERVLDIRDVSAQLLHAAYGPLPEEQEKVLTHDAIVVADNLTPSQFLSLDRRYLRGLALAHGGSTSHTVILARSLGLPCVCGIPDVHRKVTGDQEVILDAQRGLLIAGPPEPIVVFYRREMQHAGLIEQRLRVFADRRAQSADGRSIEVAANASSVEEVHTAFRNGAEGIGLFRTEMLFMDRTGPPDEEEQFAVYASVMKSAGTRPVIIRTLDIGGDKGVSYLHLPREENPFLGYRAVRLYREFKPMIDSQLRAILRASAFGNAKIMIPMICSVEEVRSMRAWISEIMDDLAASGHAFNRNIEIGIMLEIPSVAFIIDQLSPVVDFFSIGSNDLTQYFLAVDRGNEKVSGLYSSYTPSFLRLLKSIVEQAHKDNKWVGLCGELGGQLLSAPLLLGLGLNEISLASSSIPAMKERIARLYAGECEELVADLLRKETFGQVKAALAEIEGRRTAAGAPLIAGDIVICASGSSSKEEVIRELVNLLHAAGRINDPDAVEEAVWRREETYSTGIGFGVAIPHCKSSSVLTNSVAFVRPARPLLWGAPDEQPVEMVMLIAISESAPGDEHLKIIARLSRRLMHDDFRQQLLDAPTALDVVGRLGESVLV